MSDDPILRHASTIAAVREAVGPTLRALVFFGSCLSPRMSTSTSIPDVFAVVDELDGALVRLGAGAIARLVARVLPPITLAFRTSDGAPLAKLNLIEPEVIDAQLRALPDLYLAARWSKRVEIAWVRDEACRVEVEQIVARAAQAMAGVALLAPPREATLGALVVRCVTVSYEAEPRPERANKLVAVFETFAAHYRARFGPLVEREAQRRGILLEGEQLRDERPESVRRDEARALARLLGRSRRRMMARWPKQALVYRGWFPYLVGKLRRARLTG